LGKYRLVNCSIQVLDCRVLFVLEKKSVQAGDPVRAQKRYMLYYQMVGIIQQVAGQLRCPFAQRIEK
jgi:hypothetical protein